MRASTSTNVGHRRRVIGRLACAFTAAFTLTAVASPPAVAPRPSAADADLLRAEDQLFEADVKRDTRSIARGFADEAIFVHANGMTQTKADYLHATETSTMSIHSITTQQRVARIFGNIGVIRGVKSLVVGDLHLSGSYLAVYIKRDGRWQMLDSQSTPALKPADSR